MSGSGFEYAVEPRSLVSSQPPSSRWRESGTYRHFDDAGILIPLFVALRYNMATRDH
jgi:hypothetical protein